MDSSGHIEAFRPELLTETLGVERLLVFAAHPDDVDFGAAATLAALTDRGVEVTLCLLTDGDAGGFELEREAAEMSLRRRQEQQAAAEVLGLAEVLFLQERDGFVEPTLALQRDVVRVMRQVRPDMVLTSHPERAWDRLQKAHPDHLACGEAVVRACYPAVENPFAFPELLREEGLEAFRIRYLLLMGAPVERVTTRIDVTGYERIKLEALRRHFSQHPEPQSMEDYVLDAMHGIFVQARRPDEGAESEDRPEPGGHLPEQGFAEEFHLVTVNATDTISGF